MFLKSTPKYIPAFIAGALIMLMAVTPATAQNGSSSETDAVVDDFMKVYSFTANKVAMLADAMGEEQYDWRPAQGIRSVKESILHVTAAHYFFGSTLGAEVPEGINPQMMEQSDMNKDEIISAFKESVEFAKSALNNMEPAAFDEELDLFGSTYTKRQVMYIIGDHVAEHLGQLIAYARMNDVTPPWSQGQ